MITIFQIRPDRLFEGFDVQLKGCVHGDVFVLARLMLSTSEHDSSVRRVPLGVCDRPVPRSDSAVETNPGDSPPGVVAPHSARIGR